MCVGLYVVRLLFCLVDCCSCYCCSFSDYKRSFTQSFHSLEIAILQGNNLKLVWMLTKEIRLLYISFIYLLDMFFYLFVNLACYIFSFFFPFLRVGGGWEGLPFTAISIYLTLLIS